jgi:hypothetical protein
MVEGSSDRTIGLLPPAPYRNFAPFGRLLAGWQQEKVDMSPQYIGVIPFEGFAKTVYIVGLSPYEPYNTAAYFLQKTNFPEPVAREPVLYVFPASKGYIISGEVIDEKESQIAKVEWVSIQEAHEGYIALAQTAIAFVNTSNIYFGDTIITPSDFRVGIATPTSIITYQQLQDEEREIIIHMVIEEERKKRRRLLRKPQELLEEGDKSSNS